MTHIGAYMLEAVIGQGMTAVVYRARHPILQRALALKVLDPSNTHDHRLRTRLVHLARVTLDLNHPGIVNIYDVDQDGAKVYAAPVAERAHASTVGTTPGATGATTAVVGDVSVQV